jgi:cytoskeletal protein RodZ
MKKLKHSSKLSKRIIFIILVFLLLANGIYWPLVYNKKYRVHTSYETTTENVPYQMIRTDTSSLSKGQTRTDTYGQNGQNQVKYEIKTKNGDTISKTLINSVVVKQSIDARVSVGTYVPPAQPRTTYVPTYLPSYSTPSYSPTTCSTQYHTYGGYFDPSATTTCY